MESILRLIYIPIITTIVWFVIGGLLYMNSPIAKIYKKYQKHPSMKRFSSMSKYLIGVFFIAGLIPNFFIYLIYTSIMPINFLTFGLLLSGVRILPRLCDMWMQTSYPNKLLLIELINGIILSLVTTYMFSIL